MDAREFNIKTEDIIKKANTFGMKVIKHGRDPKFQKEVEEMYERV